jgi:hypothetical protein
MRIGTCNFLSYTAAVQYYKDYWGRRDAKAVVTKKLRTGKISLGAPAIKDGERLIVIDNGTRYAIE